MNIQMILYAALAVSVLALLSVVYIKKVPKRLKIDSYTEQWKNLQSLCKDKKTWPDAIVAADRLLDHALKRRRFKGKSMGERMVSAQRKFTNNDDIWFAHNLYKKLQEKPNLRLKEEDVKDALVGFRQALRDIGALEPGTHQVVQSVKKATKK